MGGMLLLCLIAGIGLGWAVRSQEVWLRRWISAAKYARLYQAYAHAAAGLLPGDADGDGFSDALEWFERTDPNQAKDHPKIVFEWNGTAPVAEYDTLMAFHPDTSDDHRSHPEFSYLVNQRRRVTGTVTFGAHRVPFSRGFPWRIVAFPGWWSAAPGGPLSGQDLIVPVVDGGAIVFDVQPSERAEYTRDWAAYYQIHFVSTGNLAGDFVVLPLWPLPSLTPTVEELQPGQRSTVDGTLSVKNEARQSMPVYRLRWPRPPDAGGSTIIEAAEPGTGAWVPVCHRQQGILTCDLLMAPADGKPARETRPDFRITPCQAMPHTDDSKTQEVK